MARTSATLQKVADSVGVSVSTVSRILSSPNFAKKETRDSVLSAAARMGYVGLRQRGVAGGAEPALRGEVLKNVVLLAPEPRFGGVRSPDWIFFDLLPTLQRIARDKGFQIVLSTYGDEHDREAALGSIRDACGVLWLADGREGELLSRVAAQLPVVVINDDSLWPPLPSVMSDNRKVVFCAVDHLVESGHRRIAYFEVEEDPVSNVHVRERVAAYQDAVRHFGIDTDPDLLVREQFGVNEHPQAVARAMDRMQAMKDRPTALLSPLCYAIQFLKETRRRSVAVPGDLSIVAIDNAPVAELVDPPLTVVDCVFGRCAEAAIELLESLKLTDDHSARSVLLEPALVIRGSTAPLAQ